MFTFTAQVVDSGSEAGSFRLDAQQLHSAKNPNNESFDFIVSPHKAKILALLDRLEDVGWHQKHGERRKQGFALVGKPGTGKTKFAVAMAIKMHRHLVKIDCSRLQSVEQLEKLINLKMADNVSINHANCVYLFEEFNMKPFLEATVQRRQSEDDKEHKKVVKPALDIRAFLSLLDGPYRYDGLIFVATTNDRDLDPRITRDGRLTLFEFDNPTASELQQFFTVHFPEQKVPIQLLEKRKTIVADFSFASAMTLVKQAENFRQLLKLLT